LLNLLSVYPAAQSLQSEPAWWLPGALQTFQRIERQYL